VFHFGILPFLYGTAEFNAIHILPDEQIMHDARAGKTERLAGQTLEARP
jgi:hypothetical protein